MLSFIRLPGISLPRPHLRWWWTTWFVFRSSATLYSFVWSQHRLPRKGGSSTLKHKGHMKTSRRGNVGFDVCMILAYTNCWTNTLSMIWAQGSPCDVTFIAECLRGERSSGSPKLTTTQETYEIIETYSLNRNDRANKQSRCWWLDTPSRSLWHRRNDRDMFLAFIWVEIWVLAQYLRDYPLHFNCFFSQSSFLFTFRVQ